MPLSSDKGKKKSYLMRTSKCCVGDFGLPCCTDGFLYTYVVHVSAYELYLCNSAEECMLA